MEQKFHYSNEMYGDICLDSEQIIDNFTNGWCEELQTALSKIYQEATLYTIEFGIFNLEHKFIELNGKFIDVRGVFSSQKALIETYTKDSYSVERNTAFPYSDDYAPYELARRVAIQISFLID